MQWINLLRPRGYRIFGRQVSWLESVPLTVEVGRATDGKTAMYDFGESEKQDNSENDLSTVIVREETLSTTPTSPDS